MIYFICTLWNGDTSGAAAATDSLDPASYTPENVEKLKNLFPAPHGMHIKDFTALEAAKELVPEITEVKVYELIEQKSKIKKGRDLHGWEFCQLLAVLNGNAKTKSNSLNPLKGLTALINDIIRGELSDEVFNELKKLRGVAISKANNGIRPICIESILLKVAGTLLLRSLNGEIKEVVGTTELGFDSLGAGEALPNIIRALLEYNKEFTVISVDATNAFNTFPRAMILDMIKQKIPTLYPFALSY